MMPLPLLPNECFRSILSFIDEKSLYQCLFINRYWCRISISMLWKEPFRRRYQFDNKVSLVINTLLACLNENEFDEISSLIPRAIGQSPLFEYGKFVRTINHDYLVHHTITWLNLSREELPAEIFDIKGNSLKTQKLVNVIYHMIMRQGSNLQELVIANLIDFDNSFVTGLSNFSIFNTYKPGITNLRSLNIGIIPGRNGTSYQNIVEFLSSLSQFCNGIVDCELRIYGLNKYSTFTESLLDIIMLQPLERITMTIDKGDIAKNFTNALEFRSKTLKELSLKYFDFQQIDLSFISKLECLEQLNF